MRVFAIGDLHLEGKTGKTMDRFGENWRDHDRKIFEAWERIVSEDDLLLLVGDTSWAMRLEDARRDLDRIGEMKGQKLMVKGNHDYWWTSVSKMTRELHPSIKVLQANSIIVNRVAVAGTRGWMCPGDTYFKGEDEKIYQREIGRLQSALGALKGREADYDSLIVALHYPPVNDCHDASGLTELIDESGADVCVYGHLHGEAIKTALTGQRGRTRYYLVSADAIEFAPAEIDIGETRENQ
jgi:predicted phosphohydrolase